MHAMTMTRAQADPMKEMKLSSRLTDTNYDHDDDDGDYQDDNKTNQLEANINIGLLEGAQDKMAAPSGSPARPLIAISVAPPGSSSSRSSASGASSTWSAAATGAQTPIIRLDHNNIEDAINNYKEDGNNRPLRGDIKQPLRPQDDCPPLGLSTNQKELNSKKYDERGKGEVAPDGGRPTAQNDTDHQNNKPRGLSNVDQVRGNFIALIRYNKLQYFYIGAIIYSVINLLYFLLSLVMIGMSTNDTDNNNDDNHDHLRDQTGRVDSCQQLIHIRSRQDNQLQANTSWLIVILIIFGNLLLASVVVLTLIGFGSLESWTSPKSWPHSKTIRLVLLQCVGIFLATFLLMAPMEIIYVKNVAQNYSNVTRLMIDRHDCQALNNNDINDDNNNRGFSEWWWFWPPRPPAAAVGHLISLLIANSRLPICALGVLLYSLPSLLEDTPILAKLICSCLMLPPIVIVAYKYLSISGPPLRPASPSITNIYSQETTFLGMSIIYLLLIFMGGLLKRYKLSRLVKRDTFEGANNLIEAKVSLEQQRQQQETLLLSVLPAYVAEQVKRNMVKKMASSEEQTSVVLNSNNSIEVQLSLPTAGTTAATAANTGGQSNRGSFLMQPLEARTSNPISSGGPQSLVVGGVGNSNRSSFIRSSSKLLAELSIGPKTASTQPNHIPQQQQPNNNNSNLLSSPNPLSGQVSAQSLNINLSSNSSQARRGFNELYIRTYNNVSLLYGDIVGFTRLCTQLSSSQLVSVLNDLFSHFDHLAERHKIMRIKILGDCYYGVSGIPEFAVMGAKSRAKSNDNHAINCVNMGLDMIQYIKCLNIERSSSSSGFGVDDSHQALMTHSVSANDQSISARQPQKHQMSSSSQHLPSSTSSSSSSVVVQSATATQNDNSSTMPVFELNMRIGIHTGHIHSGVIGLKKWQFDVWSNDVSIAMHCESSGVAGRVQVTEATVQHLHGSFTLEPAPRSERDPFMADKEIRTYLIRERVQPGGATGGGGGGGLAHLAAPNNCHDVSIDSSNSSSGNPKRHNKPSNPERREMDEQKIREATIGTIRQTLLAGEAANASSMNAYGLAMDHNDMQALDLQFKEVSLEKLYHKRLVSSASILFELLVLFLSLAVVMALINLQLGGSFAQRHHRLIVILVVVMALLFTLYLILPEHHNRLDKTSSTSSAATVKDHHHHHHRSGSTSRNFDGLLTKNNNIVLDINHENNQHLAGAAEQHLHLYNEKSARSWLALLKESALVYQLRLIIRSLCWPPLRFIYLVGMRRRPVNGGNKLSPMLAQVVFVTVILVQIYMILGQYCDEQTRQQHIITQRPLNESTASDIMDKRGSVDEAEFTPSGGDHGGRINREYYSFLNEQYQFTVIVLIIALDSSVNLLTFKRKYKFLLAIVLLQCFLLITHLNQLTTTTQSTPKHHPFVQMVCRCLVNNMDESAEAAPPDDTRRQYDNRKPNSNQQFVDYSSDALLLVLALWSLAFNRQVDYTSRTNFLWRQRLNVDHEELEYISGINKVLLENILPSHVVQHYLTNPSEQVKSQLASFSQGGRNFNLRMSFSNMRQLHGELYHEQHESVAVMFASIPHFYEFYDESDISKQGLGCIALLNEIICDFDKLLLKNKFSRIEKIKTIGSTYMAAAGLRPSNSNTNQPPSHCQPALSSHRNSAISQVSQSSGGLQVAAADVKEDNNGSTQHHLLVATAAPSTTSAPATPDELRRLVIGQQKMNLICMIQFATNLMTALNGINKQSFQVFKLRVGVNTGPVIAGVIGAQRPFYDIWGDCVNIASRMESLGEVGRIQVEERTAKLLLECLCNDTYSIVRRGPIDVKGKGGMVTYFVDKKQVGGGGSQQQPTTQLTPGGAIAS